MVSPRTLLFAAGLLAAGVALALVLRLPAPSGDAAPTTIDPAARGRGTGDRALKRLAGGEIQDLADVEVQRRGASAPVVAPHTASPIEGELPRQSAGTVRLLGQLASDGEGPIETSGAEARVYSGEMESLVKTVPISRTGRFYCDLPAPRPARNDSRDEHMVRVQAPGYSAGEAYFELSDADEGVVEVTVHLDGHETLVRGRVVGENGEAVRGATARAFTWSPESNSVDSQSSTETDEDGTFALSVSTPGWLEVGAVHVEYGVARRSAEIVAGQPVLDLAPLVLRPRAQISGILVGYGGVPIPEMTVVAIPHGDGVNVDSREGRTDSAGRFRFANLMQTSYVVMLETFDGDWDLLTPVEPPVTDFILRLGRPTILIEVRDPGAGPVSPDRFEIVRIDEASSKPAAKKPDVVLIETGPGSTLALFPSTGTYALSATLRRGEDTLRAAKTVRLGHEHRNIELQLKPDETRAIELTVTDPHGDRIEKWTVTAVDETTGLQVGSATRRSTSIELPLGSWTLRVKPTRSAYFFDFEEGVTVADADPPVRSVTLQAHEIGGRIQVEVGGGRTSNRVAGWPVQQFALDLRDASDKAAGFTSSWDQKRSRWSSPLVRPGRYTLKVKRFDVNFTLGATLVDKPPEQPQVVQEFVVEAGRTVTRKLDLTSLR